MSLPTNYSTPPAPSFIDYSKSVDQLIDEMQIEREDVNDGKNSDNAEIIDEPGMYNGLNDSDKNTPEIKSADESKNIDLSEAKLEAFFITHTIDKLNGLICGGISKEPPENFFADDAEFKTIQEYFYQYRKNSSKPLPLWLQLSVSLGTIYGPKYIQAFQVRKMKSRQSELEMENQTLRDEIEDIRKQILKNDASKTD